MRRRKFITLLGGAGVLALPSAVRAQQPKPVVGFLHPTSPGTTAPSLAALRQGLSEAGFIIGQNVVLEPRWALGDYQRLPALAAELVARKVTVIATGGGPVSANAAKAATSTIPIVFQTASDPVEFGLVASLSRPGGNLTGITRLSVEMSPKRLELLREVAPAGAPLAALLDSEVPTKDAQAKYLEDAARTLNRHIEILWAGTERDIERAFAALVKLRAGLLIGTGSFLNSSVPQLAGLCLRHALPAIGQLREFAAAGGLMSYASSLTDSYRQVGVYVGRILKGDRPADLPVQQAVRFELVLNVRTSRIINVEIPAKLLAIADEVIE